MGRIVSEQQCTPGNCVASSGPALGYGYDLGGKLTATTNSVGMGTSPLTITNSFDLAAYLSSVSSSWTAFPASLYVLGTSSTSTNCLQGTTSYGYGPVGPVSWTQGLGLSARDGFSVLERMKANEKLPSIPVIVLFGRDRVGNRDRALKAGAKTFLQKPIANDNERNDSTPRTTPKAETTLPANHR